MSFSHGRFGADTGGLSGQAEPDRCLCHATRVIIPKARRLPANNTAEHSWPEISSPKHPRHVPASVSHPSGFHPPAAPCWRSPRSRRHQYRQTPWPGAWHAPFSRDPSETPTPHRQERRASCILRSGLNYRSSSPHSSPSWTNAPHTPPGLRAPNRDPPSCQGVSRAPHLTPFSPPLNDISDTADILQMK